MTSTRDNIRRRLRKGVESTALLFVAWMICRTWFVEGLVVPLSIPSGSMAETLLGPHCRFTCVNCGHGFTCGADVPSPGAWCVCPCCGNVENNTSSVSVLCGDRVLLMRPAFFRRSLRRWEIVAFREPDRPGRLTVKRVVGLPGESVEIRDGDVYINGQIARKPLDVQQEMAVPVDQAPAGGSSLRTVESPWRPLAAESRWTASGDDFVHPQEALSGNKGNPKAPLSADRVDWLTYHPRRWVNGSPAPGPVTSELSYNQWRTQRSDEIRPVADLLLRFHAERIYGDGWLVVRAVGGSNRLETWIRPATGECEFRFNDQSVRRGHFAQSEPARALNVVFSLVDRQLLLSLNDQTVFGRVILPDDRALKASPQPLAVGTAGLGATLRGLRVDRDIYYDRPTGVLARWGFDRPVRLGPREYFVLGDNSPISDDSRSWLLGPGVPEELVVGKPVVSPFP